MGITYEYQPWMQPYTAAQLQAAAEHQTPIIGSDNNWYTWEIGTMRYVNTGVIANPGTISIPDGSVTMEKLAANVKQVAVGRNLLDNWYFVGGGSQLGGGRFPINQRGQLSYGAGYGIDRWKVPADTTISLESGGMRLTATASEKQFQQFLENYDILDGEMLTASILWGDGTLSSGTFRYDNSKTGWNTNTFFYAKGFRILITKNHGFDIVTNQSTVNVVIAAVKLELGSTQTLAHQENGVWVLNELPNYSVELLKCQRWFQTFRTQSLRPAYGADFRPVMQTDPALGTITIEGVTYYTASAE